MPNFIDKTVTSVSGPAVLVVVAGTEVCFHSFTPGLLNTSYVPGGLIMQRRIRPFSRKVKCIRV